MTLDYMYKHCEISSLLNPERPFFVFDFLDTSRLNLLILKIKFTNPWNGARINIPGSIVVLKNYFCFIVSWYAFLVDKKNM